MSDVTNTPFRPPAGAPPPKLSFSEVWRLTFQTFRLRPWTFIGFALLPLFASVVAQIPVVLGKGQRDAALMFALLGLVFALVQFAIQLIVQIATVYGAGRLMSGARFTAGEAFGVGFRRFWPMLGLVFLMLIVIAIGMVLLIIPGIIAALVLAVAVQACVLERLGPIQAMKRSAFLTRGNRWRIIGTYFVVILFPMLGSLIVGGILVAALGAGLSALAPHAAWGIYVTVLLLVLIFVPILLIFLGIVPVYIAALFVALRRIKEGDAPAEVATVFE